MAWGTNYTIVQEESWYDPVNDHVVHEIDVYVDSEETQLEHHDTIVEDIETLADEDDEIIILVDQDDYRHYDVKIISPAR